MDNETTQVYTDTGPAEVSTRKRVIMLALFISIPIAAGLVVWWLKNSTLGLGVTWLIGGLFLLTLMKWNWLKKYRWYVRDNVKAFDERSSRIGYWFLCALWISGGIVWVILGALSP